MKMKMKTAADILMTAALPILMCYSIVGETAHEVIGIAMFGLFILHHILNFGWIKSLFKGKYDLRRGVNTAVNALVFLCMVGLMYSGRLCEKISVKSKTVIKNDITGAAVRSRSNFLQYTTDTVICQDTSAISLMEWSEAEWNQADSRRLSRAGRDT